MEKYLIIHADDWGIHPAVNQAVEKLYEQGGITSSSIILPGCASNEALEYGQRRTDLCIGVHFTLTDNMLPVSKLHDVPSLLGNNGRFHHSLEGLERYAKKEEVSLELFAQIEGVRSAGITVTHLDCHQGCVLGLATGRDWLDLIWELCGKYKAGFKLPRGIVKHHDFPEAFRTRMETRLKDADDKGVPILDELIATPYEVQPGEDYKSYKIGILEALRKLKQGSVTEWTLHPALPDRNLLESHPHWTKREWEYRLAVDPDLHDLIHSESIRTISWKHLNKVLP